MAPAYQNLRRLLFLIGSPRSGTTWLAKILNSLDGVLYLHEPFAKLSNGSLEPLKSRLISTGILTHEERTDLLERMIRQYIDCSIHPLFFPNSSARLTRWSDRAAWTARSLGWKSLSTALINGRRFADFDLLIKEVDWKLQAHNIINGIAPDHLILIVRHPCAVVRSLIRGIQIGLMPAHDRHAWLDHNRDRARDLGYSAEQVTSMSPLEFLSLEWCLQNLIYQQAAAVHPHAVTIVYERLCAAPQIVARELSESLDRTATGATLRFLTDSTTDAPWQRLLGVFSSRRSYFNLFRNSSNSAAAWQSTFSHEDQDSILRIAHPIVSQGWWTPLPVSPPLAPQAS